MSERKSARVQDWSGRNILNNNRLFRRFDF